MTNTSKDGIEKDKGSLLTGFFWGCGIIIIGYLPVILSIIFGIPQSVLSFGFHFTGLTGLLIYPLPIIALIGAIIWFGKQGKSKHVKGIFLGMLAMFALVLLLVAACFGILIYDGELKL
jgi:hypothetical protein